MDILPEIPMVGKRGVQRGRNVYEGYQRGWGINRPGVAEQVDSDELFTEALRIANGRSILAPPCRRNLFLLIRFFLHVVEGDIVEFGSYKGGTAMFMASLVKRLYPDRCVYSFDTFEGMPETTDPSIDLHRAGDFRGVDYNEMVAFATAHELTNLRFVRGRIEDTAEQALRDAKIALAHIDCDLRSAVEFSYRVSKPHLSKGAYLVFDDTYGASCLGAVEAIETAVVREDLRSFEQTWPHWVFRHGL